MTPLDHLEMGDRREVRTYARSMLLKGSARSPEATSLVSEIVDSVLSPYQASKGQLRPSMVAKYQDITSPFLADLLFAASEGKWSKLETNTNALTGLPGGATAFRTFRQAMGAAGLLEELPGYRKATGLHKQSSRTSFRPTRKLLSLAEEHGVRLPEYALHFDRGTVAVPQAHDVLERRAERLVKGVSAKRLPVDLEDPKVAKITEDLQRLNAHLMEDGRISGIAFAGLRRVFNNGDHPDFDWQWHGRFYSMPNADAYERMEGRAPARARTIRIDGEEVVEVDISAAHLTILHVLLGKPFDETRDPYAVPGVDREQMKYWLLIALGSSDPALGGPKSNKARKAGIERYPFLADLPNLGIGPLELHYHEAEIMVLAMKELMDTHGVGFLPVHDALMVARGNAGVAEEAIRNAFQRYFRETLGHTAVPIPRLSVSP